MVNGGTVVLVAMGAVVAFVGGRMVQQTYSSRVKAERTANAESKSVGELSESDPRVSVSGTVESARNEVDAAIADATGPVVKTESATYNSGVSNMGEDEMHHTSSGGGYDYRQEFVRANPFTVDDGTGTVQVAADGGTDAVVEPSGHIDVDGEASLPPDVSALVDEAGDDLIIGSQTDRIRQGVITVGDDVTVQGVPRETGGDVTLAAGDAPVLVSDRSKSETGATQEAGGVGKYVLGTVLLLAGLGLMAFPFVGV